VHNHFPQLTTAKIVIGVAAIIAVYFLATFVGNAIKGRQLDLQEQALNSEIRAQQERYQELQALEQYLKSDEYIEQVAREQLGLVKPGETGIIAIPAEPSPTPAPDSPQPDLWWERLIR
jgi:cell division protein FtsL